MWMLPLHAHLSDEVVVQEDVGWSRQDGVGWGVGGLGLQEGVGGESRDRAVRQLRDQVNQRYRHLCVQYVSIQCCWVYRSKFYQL